MKKPRVIILRTAGTNCDAETAHAWELAGAQAERVHVGELIERPDRLHWFAILTIPGGFSYGDDIAAGKILAMQLVHHLADALREFVAAGKLILGICNGFQVLVKAGLLPGDAAPPPHDEAQQPCHAAQQPRHVAQRPSAVMPGHAGSGRVRQQVTLTVNDSARFEARWIHLRSSAKPNAFLPGERILSLPIAHGEGKLVAADDGIRSVLERNGHIALTYCDAEGRPGPYPINPNGSEADIAGLVNETGRVLGLMPHPERFVDPTQHPVHCGLRIADCGFEAGIKNPQSTIRHSQSADGRIFFETAVHTARSL